MLKIDLHIHTTCSGHAYGTFYDIVREAMRKEMTMIGISDHGPSLDGTSGKIHFHMGKRKPKFENLRVLWGCEANIIDEQGNLDIDEEIQNKLDYIIVGLHTSTSYEDLGKKRNTDALKRALANPKVKFFAHPTHQGFDVDYEELVRFGIMHNVIPELNLSYLRYKADGYNFVKFQNLIKIVKEMGFKLILNSDAHFIHEVGDDSILEKHWKKLGLTKDLIINNNSEELCDFLGIEQIKD